MRVRAFLDAAQPVVVTLMACYLALVAMRAVLDFGAAHGRGQAATETVLDQDRVIKRLEAELAATRARCP